MSGLVLKNVNKIYPSGQQAVKDFNLEIENREFLILTGPTGCGKSTLLRMIAGLEEISSGSLFIGGKDMTDSEPRDRNIAMVFKNSILYPEMSVLDNLSFALRMGKMAQNEIDERVKEAAGFLNLDSILEQMPAELTKEETYRVLLGRALVRRPAILLLDSIIADLEEELQVVLRRELLETYRKMDMTVIYATDNQGTAGTLATRMIVMEDGMICQDDTYENLVKNPVNRFVAGVVGRVPMNFFPATVLRQENQVGLKLKSGQILLPGEAGKALIDGAYHGKEVVVGVRADGLHLEENVPGNSNGVLTVTFQGMVGGKTETALKFLENETEGLCLVSQAPDCEAGGKIKLSVDAKGLYLFDRETGKTIVN